MAAAPGRRVGGAKIGFWVRETKKRRFFARQGFLSRQRGAESESEGLAEGT